MIFKPKVIFTACLSLFVANVLSAHEPPKYRLTDLGLLPNSLATTEADSNDFGAVVGSSTTDDYYIHAYVYFRGTITDLGSLGGDGAQANGINNLGEVVGLASLVGVANHAFLYSHGTMQDLGTLGGLYSEALGINDLGVTVGDADLLGDETAHAVIWRRGRSIEDIGTLGGQNSFALSINLEGQVTGISDLDLPFDPNVEHSHAFLYVDGHMRDIGTLGGAYSLGARINSFGEIAGSSTLAGEAEEHAFVYRFGQMQDLGTLGGSQSRAYGLNNRGEVTGRSTTINGRAGFDDYDAFVYTDGVMYDLNDLIADDDPVKGQVVFHISDSINDLGWITAEGDNFHSYIFKPVESRQ